MARRAMPAAAAQTVAADNNAKLRRRRRRQLRRRCKGGNTWNGNRRLRRQRRRLQSGNCLQPYRHGWRWRCRHNEQQLWQTPTPTRPHQAIACSTADGQLQQRRPRRRHRYPARPVDQRCRQHQCPRRLQATTSPRMAPAAAAPVVRLSLRPSLAAMLPPMSAAATAAIPGGHRPPAASGRTPRPRRRRQWRIHRLLADRPLPYGNYSRRHERQEYHCRDSLRQRFFHQAGSTPIKSPNVPGAEPAYACQPSLTDHQIDLDTRWSTPQEPPPTKSALRTTVLLPPPASASPTSLPGAPARFTNASAAPVITYDTGTLRHAGQQRPMPLSAHRHRPGLLWDINAGCQA